MTDNFCDYLIVGAGLAGASAVEGIRQGDPNGSITVIGAESHPPYDRPPLSKKLWFGKQQVQDVFLHDEQFYQLNGVTLLTGRRVVRLHAEEKTVHDHNGESYRFGKLLLATGGTPDTLRILGGNLEDVCYYRTLGDYERMRSKAAEGKSALVIGGGFIGSEMAAALQTQGLSVTMVYPSAWLCHRVFPQDLGLALERRYEERGIRILKQQRPISIERERSRLVVKTSGGERMESDLLIVGIGIKPGAELAEEGGLRTADGIVVDEYLRTSRPDIYAAGDNARFPYAALGQQVRLEHWDNALNQGRLAGRNMAGAHEPYTYLPFFFSDLFEFGYEAVGEIDSRMQTAADWQKPYDTGVVYYSRDGIIRGAMMCNVWDKVDAARALITSGARADRMASL